MAYGRVTFSLAVALFPLLAAAQPQVSGTLTGFSLQGPVVQWDITFNCTGTPICIGTHNSVFVRSDCRDDPFVRPGAMTLYIDTTRPPGPLPVDFFFHEARPPFVSPSCSVYAEPPNNGSLWVPGQGSWNGSTGNFVSNSTTGTFTVAAAPPLVFPMTVTSNIGATSSSATAQVQYRPQDVGTNASLYVFAVAPRSVVTGATANEGGAACVLAQLDTAGRLHAVSTTSLQAHVTSALTSQGQAVTLLDNVPNANIEGAVFYVGYGPTTMAMIANGLNQRAVEIPGAKMCNPQRPQTGWWWNPAEGGRGYSIEIAGNRLFFAAYLYDEAGRATWLVASGKTSLDGSLYTGSLESYAGGQSLSSAYVAPTGSLGGPITLAFSDASHGTLSWAGGTLPIERFNVVPDGLSYVTVPGQPQVGWWWNPNESGRGYFLEWQGGQLFMAGYMYDSPGNPIWYLSSNLALDRQAYSSNWLQFGNGQTLTGTYRQPTQVNANVAPVTITFQGAENAIMTLPGGRTTAITRFRF